MPIGQDDTSEFNMGLAYLETLRFLLNAADRAAISLNPHGWLHALMALSRELSDDLNELQQKEDKQLRANVMRFLPYYGVQHRGQIVISQQLYDALERYETFLRKVMKAKGYKTRYQESPGLSLS